MRELGEIEALLVRLSEMRRGLLGMAKDRAQSSEGSTSAEDLYAAEQALAQAERLLRRVRATLS